MEVAVVVEVPAGSRNKYEVDQEHGQIWLDRTLFTATAFPLDYGYIDGTRSSDGEQLDALVVLEEPTFPGCRIRCRAAAVLWIARRRLLAGPGGRGGGGAPGATRPPPVS